MVKIVRKRELNATVTLLEVEAPLIIEGEGGFSPEMLRIYGKG